MADQEFTTEELKTEEWRDIPGFGYQTSVLKFRYQVSNLGRIRSVRIQVLKATPWSEYLRITLFKGKQTLRRFKSFGVHQLVARMYIGPRPEGHWPNHEDGNKLNNRASNLNYQTPSGNNLHAIKTGLARRGEQKPNAKLTNQESTEIVKLLAAGRSAKSLARRFNLSDVAVSNIKRGLTWKHIPRPDCDVSRLGQLPYTGPPQGSDSPNAKVDEQIVLEIREMYASGSYKMREIAETFSLGKSQIKRIIDRKSWAHVR